MRGSLGATSADAASVSSADGVGNRPAKEAQREDPKPNLCAITQRENGRRRGARGGRRGRLGATGSNAASEEKASVSSADGAGNRPAKEAQREDPKPNPCAITQRENGRRRGARGGRRGRLGATDSDAASEEKEGTPEGGGEVRKIEESRAASAKPSDSQRHGQRFGRRVRKREREERRVRKKHREAVRR